MDPKFLFAGSVNDACFEKHKQKQGENFPLKAPNGKSVAGLQICSQAVTKAI